MTICNKIQTLGETMETNLNARGVSCTFGTGTGESTVLDMVEMVNSTNFKGSSDVNLKIGANRPYLLTGETTDVVVKLENGLCEPLKNKNVIVGKSVFRDGGVTGDTNSNWYKNSGTDNRTVTATGTTLANTTSTRYDIFAYFGIPYQIYVFQPPYTVEFDIVDIVGSSARFQIYDKVTTDTYNGGSSVGHWKIVYDGTTIKPYKNGVEQTNYTRNMPNARIGFYIPQNCSITYKNFVIYETINGVTDGKGEFALYDVSVTDDTTFTATYSNVSAICKVFPCLIADYGVTENYSNLFNVMTMFTRQSDGTKFYYENTGSSTYQVYTSQVSITDEVGIDFELIECTSCLLQVARYKTGASTEYLNKTVTSKGKVHIEIKTTGTYVYLNDTLIQSETEQTNMESVRLFFRVASNNIANFKYRNLGIYYRG